MLPHRALTAVSQDVHRHDDRVIGSLSKELFFLSLSCMFQLPTLDAEDEARSDKIFEQFHMPDIALFDTKGITECSQSHHELLFL